MIEQTSFWDQHLDSFIVGVGAAIAACFSFLVGRRKQSVDIETAAITGANIAVDAMIKSITQLQRRVEDLEGQVGELQTKNAAKDTTIEALRREVAVLRGTVEKDSHVD